MDQLSACKLLSFLAMILMLADGLDMILLAIDGANISVLFIVVALYLICMAVFQFRKLSRIADGTDRSRALIPATAVVAVWGAYKWIRRWYVFGFLTVHSMTTMVYFAGAVVIFVFLLRGLAVQSKYPTLLALALCVLHLFEFAVRYIVTAVQRKDAFFIADDFTAYLSPAHSALEKVISAYHFFADMVVYFEFACFWLAMAFMLRAVYVGQISDS